MQGGGRLKSVTDLTCWIIVSYEYDTRVSLPTFGVFNTPWGGIPPPRPPPSEKRLPSPPREWNWYWKKVTKCCLLMGVITPNWKGSGVGNTLLYPTPLYITVPFLDAISVTVTWCPQMHIVCLLDRSTLISWARLSQPGPVAPVRQSTGWVRILCSLLLI